MSMQRIMRRGHDFPKDKGVAMLTLSRFRENPCVMGRNHQNCQLPSFLSSLPNHLFFQKVVEVVSAWKGRVWEILNAAEHLVWSVVFCLQGQENTRTVCQFDPCIRAEFSYSHIFESYGMF